MASSLKTKKNLIMHTGPKRVDATYYSFVPRVKSTSVTKVCSHPKLVVSSFSTTYYPSTDCH